MYKVRDPRGISATGLKQKASTRPPLNNIRLVHPKSKQQTGKAFAPKFKWEDDTDAALDIPDFLLKDPNAAGEGENKSRRLKQALLVAAAVLLLSISGLGIFTDYLTADVGLMSRDTLAQQAAPSQSAEAQPAETRTPSIFDEVRVSRAQIGAAEPDPAPSARPSAEPEDIGAASTAVAPPAEAIMPTMITIERGQYLIPKAEVDRGKLQLQNVSLDRFQIATSEVTRKQWQACAAENGCSVEGFPDQYFNSSKLALPITAITTDQMMSFIDWINTKRNPDEPPFRLPSDEEWIVAARGGETGHRNFAWGQDFDPAKIRATDMLIPVDHGEPVNGLYGMSDNAAERVTGCWIKELAGGRCFRNLGTVLGPIPGKIDNQTASLNHRIGRSNNTPYQNIGFRLAQ
ncbi:SUMF1/EgtB/PvdO family nonheme iron enzyme [Nitratireductor sp. XY-223]|uniref:formylglycine-generating enzyme family protein n=1 Tax=Nitratireductor sp. XY-223 TaxID=2561926 RepID=UPI0010AAB1F1|nr:SUMF1/EgtB/PvdO family nonheme iron enzyme [Nitratireductor sp. XY-223]